MRTQLLELLLHAAIYALLLPFVTAVAPQYARDYATHATALQASLLAGYNTNVPPVTNSRSPNNVAVSDAGTDIQLQLRVFKVDAVDAAHGQMSLKIWLRHSWVDKRLAWNETEWGGINMIALSTDRPQEIWLPDLQPYNSLISTDDSLAYTDASVYSDGSIFWSRPGILTVMCKFSGLVAFPYDQLACSLEFGGWSWSGSHQGLEPYSSGAASFSSQEATAGSSFTEYAVREIAAEPVTYEYDCCPSEPWPVIFYTITLRRSSDYYFHLLLWPYVTLTSVSFLVFFMSYEVGERLSFGITLILAIEVSKSVFSGMIPVCGEVLWLELFAMLNLIFCILSLAESCVVLFLSHYKEEHLVPLWMVEMFWTCVPTPVKSMMSRKQIVPVANAIADVGDGADKMTRVAKKKLASMKSSIASQMAKSMNFAQKPPPNQQDDSLERLSLFERYYTALDSEADGSISLAETYEWLSFTCMHASPSELWAAINKANIDNDESIVLSEFMMVCCDLLWDVPLARLQTLHETQQKVQAQRSSSNHLYWIRMANRVDGWCACIIPPSYFTLLILLVNADLRDAYIRPPTDPTKVVSTGVVDNEMFSGIHSVGPMSGGRFFVTILIPLIVVLMLIGSCVAGMCARSAQILPASEVEVRRRQRTRRIATTDASRYEPSSEAEDK